MKRRKFIRQATAAGLVMGAMPLWARPGSLSESVSLTILHTNDVHSRIDPFPLGSGRNSGLGGAAVRAELIRNIRAKEKNVLLLDAGDMLQGTPYFNLFKGEVEFKLMNAMKYDVATIGNHDFDAGIDHLGTNAANADFSLVSVNYNFTDTPLNGFVKPYTIREFDGVKVGIFGVGIQLESLVPSQWYGKTHYTPPIGLANKIALQLKKNEKCDYVICLSHLGYKYKSTKLSDVVFSQSTANIDLIIGGHTHTFLDFPDVRRNREGQPVIISQVGWAGMKLGRLDISFESNSNKASMACNHTWVRDLGK